MAGATEEQRRQWEQEGYVRVDGAIAGEQLQRLQSAFDYWADACREEWVEAIERGEASPTWYDVPDPFARDDAFIDLVDHPGYCPLVAEFCGGDPVLSAIPQVRTVPCWPVSYTGWHPDRDDDGVRRVKMQLYVNDVPAAGGEFAYVPGSHLAAPGTWYRPGRNDAMPGHVCFTGKAGTAVLFDNRGLHTAMDNTTGAPRKSIIMGFHERAAEQAASDAFAGLAGKLKTPERRRLFGLE